MADLADLSLDDLEAELATWASHLTAGMCRWLELVAEIDRRGRWADDGRESCGAWLAWRCGLMPRAAREHVRVARRLAELPLIHGAFARGELSYAKVRALTRVAEPDCERDLIELAAALTAAQLERILRTYRRITTEEAADVQERAFLDVRWDDDGSLRIRGRLSAEEGAAVLGALEATQANLRKDAGGSAEPRPTLAEALVSLVRAGAEPYQVVVHVDADALGDGRGACVLDDGPPVAPETARRLACDASVVRLSARAGRPLGVGRKTRAVSSGLRRALRARDGTCRFPGCERRRYVEAHHVRHWARGGETSLANLVLLCSRHHRLVHEGGYSVEAVGARLRFTDPRGRRIPAVHRPPPGDAGRLQVPPHDPSSLWPGDGGRMDLAAAVDAVFQAVRRSSGRPPFPHCSPATEPATTS